ncbi:MAG: alpha/beta fold hydrolase [Rhodococcus sp.]|nr:alpha/beta fold hydrolase [Rhodococcus sp. (in: high G+C Gram-positive bacteria)]
MRGMEEVLDTDGVRGVLHRPDGEVIGALALTHGAGSNCNTVLLTTLAEAFAERGVLVLRYDLPYRVRRASGPPHPSKAAEDRDGVRAAVGVLRELTDRPVVAGGHSYGGRQASMVAAESPGLIDGLLLSSYPLHPPAKPEKLRTEHLPDLETPAIVIHGSKDPFATTDEMRAALDLIPARTTLIEFEGAKHDLDIAKYPVVERVVPATLSDMFGR